MNEKLILVVEDSRTQGEALRGALEDQGIKVELVTSGEAALERLAQTRKQPIDLVVSDVVMPGIDGYELCRRIKSSPSQELPVVLLTSLTDPMAIVRGLECGADNYVTKPYTLSHLLPRIRNAMDKYAIRAGTKSSLGVNVRFMDTNFTITSGKEQILDLFISSIEDVVRMNNELQANQRELAATQKQLEEFASRMARQAEVTEEKYSALMHSANDAIVILDKDGRIADANLRATELLGTKRPLPGRTLLEFVSPGSREKLAKLLAKLVDARRVSEDNIAILKPDGTPVYCDVSGSRTKDDGADLSLVILHDVTERRKNEEGLRLSEQKLAEAQRISGLGSWEWDLRTDQLTWSDEIYRIFGEEKGTFVPSYQRFMEHVHPDDKRAVEEGVRLAIEKGIPFSVEIAVVRSDKSIRHLQSLGKIRRDESGMPTSFFGTTLDVTERKNLEQQLRQSQKMEAIGQLAGGIAHDFNNLLTVINGNSEFALETLGTQSPAYGDIAEIKRAAASAATLTQQLLAFSRRQVLKPTPIELRSVALNVERMLRRLIGENIELELDLRKTDGLVLCDPGQIEQVLVNLTVNSRDAMPRGGKITIRTHAVSSDSLDRDLGLTAGTYEVLEVADTGTGMDKETRDRIFEPFFTTKPVGRGTGLGLSTVHGIVKQSGGEIQVDSAVDEGTIFSVFLPRVAGHVTAETRAVSRDRGGSETILLVEDEAALRNLAKKILTRKGYRVFEAGDAETALRVSEKEIQNVDLVLTDVVMPGMNVNTMVKQITEMNPNLKILFMSGYHDDHLMMQNLSPSTMDFLHKPFSPEALSMKVREVLDREAVR